MTKGLGGRGTRVALTVSRGGNDAQVSKRGLPGGGLAVMWAGGGSNTLDMQIADVSRGAACRSGVSAVAVLWIVLAIGGTARATSSVHQTVTTYASKTAQADAARTDQVPGEVLVRIRENAAIAAVTRQAHLPNAATARVHPIEEVAERLRKSPGLSRDADGLYHLSGRPYRTVQDIPEEALFVQAYERMGPAEKVLYRNYRVRLPGGASVAAAIQELMANPAVEYAEPNYLATTSFVPNDPYYGAQWSHQITTAERGWDTERGDPAVTLAIIDTGVDYAHEDLAPNVWHDALGHPGKDFVDIDTQAYVAAGYTLLPSEDYTQIDDDPGDVLGHGTHCAGIAGAAGGNGVGVAGVCHRCRIMPVRAGFAIGVGSSVFGSLESDDIANAIRFAADNGADVISMSFGSPYISQTMQDAVAYAISVKGAILVAAAGNDTSDSKSYPAAFDGVISVAATAIDDARAYYSNYGTWVTVAAPGGDSQKGPTILSTLPNGEYDYLQGTSMACPYVAGLAGLLRSQNPALTPTEVRQILRFATDPPISDHYIGAGRVNVSKALQVASPPTGEARISRPVSGDVLGPAPVDIRGTASGSSYVLEIANNPYAQMWTEIARGTQVIDGSLGILDPTQLQDGISYFIRVTVFDTVEITDVVEVSFDKRLHPGWPQSTGAPILASPAVYDLDGDGRQEIIVAAYGSGTDVYGSGTLHIWRHDGTAYPGWPVHSEGPLVGSPAVGDLDQDGMPEIVTTGWAGVFVFNRDGTPRPGWPMPLYAYQPPVLVDLDGDGNLEIVVPASNGAFDSLYAWHHDGSLVAGWPQQVRGTTSAAVADLDGDGRPEIVVGTHGEDYSGAYTEPREVYVWHHDGTLASGWPQPTVGSVTAPPVIGDLDGDGTPEIVAISAAMIGSDQGKAVYAWHDDGTLVAGFPVFNAGQGINTPPILSDLDGDGDLEILFEGDLVFSFPTPPLFFLEAYHHDGSPVSGWPVAVPPSQNGNNGGGMQFVAGDIDGDGRKDVVAKVADRLLAWHDDGTLVAGFPLLVDDQSHTGSISPFPVIADVDGDGQVDLVAAANFDRVFIFDLSAAFRAADVDWPMYQHDARNTGHNPSCVASAPGCHLATPTATPTLTPVAHDSVVAPHKPLTVIIPAGGTSATKRLKVKVTNADTVPAAEHPGHTVQLTASDGDCPAGTVEGMPLFAGTGNTVQIAGGRSKKAEITLHIAADAFTSFNRKAFARCRLSFTATTITPAGSFDPTPANNTATVELNVIDGNDPEQTALHESLLWSIAPRRVIICKGRAAASKVVKPIAGNADMVDVAGHAVRVTASDGDCPAGTVGVVDFESRTPGAQDIAVVAGGGKRSGQLALVIDAARFTTTSRRSPARCTAVLTAAGPSGDTDATNNSTRLVIDVVDENDF